MFANNSEFFDASHGQSVIVRQPQQQPPPDEEFGSPFPVTSTSCLPSTPLTPGYSGYSGQFPFPFFPPELAQTFAQSFVSYFPFFPENFFPGRAASYPCVNPAALYSLLQTGRCRKSFKSGSNHSLKEIPLQLGLSPLVFSS